MSEMRNYFDILSSVGCRVSDGGQILHILVGLGQKYDPAVQRFGCYRFRFIVGQPRLIDAGGVPNTTF